MSRSDTMKNDLAQAYANQVTAISLHNGDPGTTGANDLVATVPHASITWPNPPSAGVIVSAAGTLVVPSGTTATHVGLWSGATYLDSIANNVAFSGATNYQVTIRYTQDGA